MRTLRTLVTLLAVIASVAPAARADLASMVTDLEVGSGPNASSGAHDFARVGSRVVFLAQGSAYVTDGTPAGTTRLPAEDYIQSGVEVVAGAYLLLGVRPTEEWTLSLWGTDGEAAGTARLVDGLYHPSLWWCQPPLGVLARRDLFLFLRYTDRPLHRDLELWQSDGSPAGTHRVALLPAINLPECVTDLAFHRGGIFYQTASFDRDAETFRSLHLWRTDLASGRTQSLGAWGGSPIHSVHDAAGKLYPVAERLFFVADGRLWATDGTRRGTAPVPGPPGEAGFQLGSIAGVAGRTLLFAESDSLDGAALWATDGTGAGTRILARGLVLSSREPLSLGNTHFFVALDEEHGWELWGTRGTPATTALLADLCAGPCSGLGGYARVEDHVVAGGRLFVVADAVDDGAGLWVSDGTAAGTERILDLESDVRGLPQLCADGDEVLFYHRDSAGNIELWASDGTTAGSRRIPGFAVPHDLAPEFPPSGRLPAPKFASLGSRIVTVGWGPRAGLEPWALRRDGGGGRALADLALGGGRAESNPFDGVALGDRLVFMAGDSNSTSAWATRGTAETTVQLGEISVSRSSFYSPLTAVVGGTGYLNLGDLWRTDGTEEGTVRLTDFAVWGTRVSTPVVDLGGRAVFGVTVDGVSTYLWVSEGTPETTRPVTTIPPSPPPFPPPIEELTAAGGRVYFWARDDLWGWDVWTGDSTLQTFSALTDLDSFSPPTPSWSPVFAQIGGHVFFVADDTLWRTDGTVQGTVRVPTPVPDGEAEQPVFVGLGSSILLLTRSSEHLRLWAGDGAGSDWTELRDFGPGSSLGQVIPRAEDVLMTVYGEGGVRLIRTDGTAAGTGVALDFSALDLEILGPVTAAGERIFFFDLPGEIWLSDGTQATTRRLQTIAPDGFSYWPSGFTVAGSRLYFAADDGLHGRELWSLPLDELEAPCRPSGTALCLGGGRFRAELFRHDRTGERGDGRAVAWSSASGMFWFYGYGNPEAVVKMVDGGAVNGKYWLFYGTLGDAYAALTVTDLETGEVRRYPAEPGPLPAFADLAAFSSGTPVPAGALGRTGAAEPLGTAEPSGEPAATGELEWLADLERAAAAPAAALLAPEVAACSAGPCIESRARLCLQGGRFAVDLAWRDGSGAERAAFAFPHGDRAGFFSFYGAGDLQAALKILDARAVSGRFWLFATSLTHLGTTLTVTDTETATVHRYHKPAGEFASVIDLTSLR